MSGAYDNEIFTSRGILPEIARARPYLPWVAPVKVGREWADPNCPLRVEFDYDDLTRKQKQHLTRIGNQSSGYVIVRYAAQRLRGLPRIYPELRPHGRVKVEPPTRHVHNSDRYAEHIAKGFKDNPDPVRWPVASPNGEPYFYGGHGGIDYDGPHYHLRLVKYVFPVNNDVQVWHDHDECYDGKPEVWRRSHVKREHDGRNAGGLHWHWRKDRKNGLAKRIDVHPWSESLFDDAEVVFFGIEGCMKSDAMLSAGEAVFSVPAVGQWRAPELRQFAKRYRLREKIVVIVPDADWFVKDGVIRQARECQDYLYRLGISAHIAAPPRRELMRGIKGVDDFLGHGGKLEDLEVIGFEPDPIMVEYVLSWPSVRTDARLNAVRILRTLAVSADRDGRGRLSRRALGRELGIDRMTVTKALERLQEHGAVAVDDDSYVIAQAYRAREMAPERLGEFLQRSGRQLTRRAALAAA